jgi:hypothetical protein
MKNKLIFIACLTAVIILVAFIVNKFPDMNNFSLFVFTTINIISTLAWLGCFVDILWDGFKTYFLNEKSISKKKRKKL